MSEPPGLYGQPIGDSLTTKLSLAQQVHDILCEEIQKGRWRIGEQLPSVSSMAEQSGLTRSPIQRAFEMLREEGYLRQENRTGTFLSAVFPKGKAPLGSIGVLLAERDSDKDAGRWWGRWLLHTVLEVSIKRNYATELISLSGQEDPDSIDKAGGLFSDRVRGIISFCSLPRAPSLALGPGRLPIVFQGVVDETWIPCVLDDRRRSFYLLTKRAIKEGHREIVCCVDEGVSAVGKQDIKERLAGHVAAMEDAGLPVNTEAMERRLRAGDPSIHPPRDFIRAFPDATVILGTTATISRRIIAAADALGIRVPDQLSVICANPGPMREEDPDRQLTCVDPNHEKQIEICLDVLEEMARNRRYPLSRLFVDPVLKEGRSLAPPRAEARIPLIASSGEAGSYGAPGRAVSPAFVRRPFGLPRETPHGRSGAMRNTGVKKRGELRAFTLIELLIVVAIIAILAAIAVPNFLEAQVRAKVARAKADMRTFATALECYAVDSNRAPLGQADYLIAGCVPSPYPNTYAGQELAHNAAQARLTTPVAYLTTLPLDPFKDKGGVFMKATIPYNYRLFHYQCFLCPKAWNNYVLAHQQYGYDWAVWSVGPDRNGSGGIPLVLMGKGYTAGSREVFFAYDPSNGTVSSGWIIRTNKGVFTAPSS